jgi:hypothetical protein
MAARKKKLAAPKKRVAKKKARKKAPARKRLAARKPAARKKHARKRRPGKHHPPLGRPIRITVPLPRTTDVSVWLQQNPRVAGAIKWQFRPGDVNDAYVPPAETDKLPWPAWTAQQQADLIAAYNNYRSWFAAGAPQAAIGGGGLTDAPPNQFTGSDSTTALEMVAPAYMWQLYVAHVAFALAAEITNVVPWSIASYNPLALRYLFDSSTMAWAIGSGVFKMGTYVVFVPPLRADNLPKTAFASPQWTYPFLVQNALIGNTRLNTIGRVLQWMRQNLSHFFGNDDLGTCDAIWQYRGYPPLSRIIGGTIDANNPGYGKQHWTLGCHGSVGFLNAVLRIVNIPVQPVWVCDHELAYLITEGKYLDHGDDPYNQNVKNSSQPILDVLIDEATYQNLFTTDPAINITDPNSPACPNVGYTAAHFPP